MITGTGVGASLVANNILERGLIEKIEISPMKLQKLLYFVTCLYQRRTGQLLLAEQFQPWQYGPVCRSIYDEFKSYGARPIDRYAQDAFGEAYQIDTSTSPDLAYSLDLVWGKMKSLSATRLSQISHRKGGAWAVAVKEGYSFISPDEMAKDSSFFDVLGLSESPQGV